MRWFKFSGDLNLQVALPLRLNNPSSFVPNAGEPMSPDCAACGESPAQVRPHVAMAVLILMR
jgi:hypothetical protein